MVGVHMAGEDGVAADAVLAEIDGHALGQAQHPGLGNSVGGVGFPGAAAVYRRGADDGAAVALRDHGSGGLLRAEVETLEADIEVGVPVVFAQFEKVLTGAAVGIVGEDVDTVEAGDKGCEHPRDLRAVGDSAGEEFGLAAHGADQAQGLLGVVVVVEVVDADIAAGCGEGQGDAAADAALAAGDEGFFAAQVVG